MLLSSLPVRRLGMADLNACATLCADRGWAPERRSWALMLDAAEAYGVDAPDGDGLAGSVVLARYGTTLASAGMMLVASRYSRQGLGRALMEHIIGQAGGSAMFLTATEPGRPLYAKCGFRPVGRRAKCIGSFARGRDTATATRRAGAADMPVILETDFQAFGEDRRYLLSRLPEFADEVRVAEDARGLAGYAAAWRADEVAVIGPVVANDEASAAALIADLAGHVRGMVRIDLDAGRKRLLDWVAEHGLRQITVQAFMVRGDWPPPGDRERIYAPLS